LTTISIPQAIQINIIQAPEKQINSSAGHTSTTNRQKLIISQTNLIMFPFTLLLALAAPLTISSLPTSSPQPEIVGRSCSVQYPELRSNRNQSMPYSVDINSSKGVEIGFTIPDDAVGPCSLMLEMPSGADISGSAQVNVFALDGPAPGALVGTTTFASGSWATINSFACRPQMCYSLKIASGDSTLQFMEQEGMGVVMTYNC
jgi:hypothetical protein